MRYTKGGFPFKTDLKDLSGTTDEPGTKVDLTVKPNPTTKAVHDFSGVDQNELTKQDMENKQDFNISNLHKATKMSLKDKNYANSSDLEKNDDDRPYAIKEAAAGNKQDKKEDAEGK